MCCCTFIADCADASVEILKTDHTQTAGIQEPCQILHLKPQTHMKKHTTYSFYTNVRITDYIITFNDTKTDKHELILPQKGQI